jgi:hypothetical protein
MGWFDKHKPAAGSDAAKNADEQSEAQVNALVEKLGASIEERIAKPLGDRIDKLQSEWETIKAEATKPPAAAGPTNADGTPRELSQEEKNTLGTQAAFAQSVLTNARLTEREVLDGVHASWAHLIPQIRAYFTSTPLDRKAKPDYAEYCQNIVDMVVGKAANAAGLRSSDGGKTFFLEDKSGAGASGEENILNDPSLTWRKPDGTVVTGLQTLAALDIDPAKFAESVKKGVV